MTVYPMAGYMLHPDPAVLDRQRHMARPFGLPVIWGTDPTLEGRSLSVARDARVPAIYAEFLGGGGCDPGGVAAYVSGCRNILIDLGMIDGEVVFPDVEPIVVEDARPGSGILQVQHPAPIGGVFEPAVALGDAIEEGEPSASSRPRSAAPLRRCMPRMMGSSSLCAASPWSRPAMRWPWSWRRAELPSRRRTVTGRAIPGSVPGRVRLRPSRPSRQFGRSLALPTRVPGRAFECSCRVAAAARLTGTDRVT